MDYITNYLKEREEKTNKVTSEEYIEWLVLFTNKHRHWSDETFLYKKDEIDITDYDNTLLISYFQDFISQKANEQNILSICEDCDCIYYFKLQNSYYEIGTVFGQGAFTYIHLLETEPKFDIVKLDEEVSKEELLEKELVQYIIINKDLIDKISPSKFAIHVGHACSIVADKQSQTDEYKRWFQKGKVQKKIILKTSQKRLEELEKDFFSVRDLGFTEVEENTLIAVSLGIMTRKQAKPYIKRMQLWN